MADYTVRQGDCISSISARFGLLPESLWDHPDNAQLKELRGDMNVLYPGDVLFVPDKAEKTEPGATEQKHRFRKKNTPAVLRIQLLDAEDNPRSGVSYTLDVDGRLISGTTDADGILEHSIPSDARAGRLIPQDEDAIPLDLGGLDPIDTLTGVKQRLSNLGYDCDETTDTLDEEAQDTLKAFQKQYELEETGEPDQATKDKLQEIHGS